MRKRLSPRAQKITRRAFLGLAAWVCATPPYAYASTFFPRVEHTDITLPRLPPEADGLRVALLADTHVGRWRGRDYLAHAVEITNAQKPDLALLLGDYCHGLGGKPQSSFDDAILGFGELTPTLGTYAVPGNHDAWDGWDEVCDAFDRIEVPLMKDVHTLVDIPGGRLALVGLDDMWTGSERYDDAFRDVPGDLPRITLSHNPDVFLEIPRHDLGLMVAGHTHGGQIVIPGIGPLQLPTSSGKKYAAGHVMENGHQLYVTRGVGTVTPPVRLFCPAEVSILTLRYASSESSSPASSPSASPSSSSSSTGAGAGT